MPARNRSAGRTVHIYDANDPTAVLGGLILTNGITNANFYSMVEILVIFESTFLIRDEGRVVIQRDNSQLQPGNYYITSSEPFSVNNESWLLRTISQYSAVRTREFCNNVRTRDGRCVITGRVAVNAHLDNWVGFEAAHIFPLAYESHWDQYDFDRWITIQPNTGGSINSAQNGLLLKGDIHSLFDYYLISINPDDNYKIVCFALDGDGIAGGYLDQQFLSNPRRPVDQLLRWHFRQAVLANMRGAGEPMFEHDFPPGSDIVGDILYGPKAVERMEFELFSRLAGFSRENDEDNTIS